ncbi:MAG: PKD domain-containing protein [Spirochaetales bacterium]|nr:PKD domain-containing protein [Spirochaetales bacterium]
MKKLGFSLLSLGVLLSGCSLASQSTVKESISSTSRSTVSVSDGESLQEALAAAAPGDTILLESGTYTVETTSGSFETADGGSRSCRWYFRCEEDGSADNPITLKSSDSSDPAVLCGAGWSESGYGLYITGDYWVVQDIVITESAKGIVLDNSYHSSLTDLEICEIGQEGIHVRDGSSYTTIDGVNLHDIGKEDDGYGEGIYIGSDNSVWWEGDGVDTGESGLYYHREVMDTHVTGCTVGPEITAEPFDIKEGSYGTIVEYCTIYGSGVSGNNFADSHMDIKGYETIIRYNDFYQEENENILRSIMVVPRISSGVDAEYTAHDIYLHDNTFTLYTDDVEVAVANSGSEDIYAWDNTRDSAEGNYYNSLILEEVPEGYDEEDDNNAPVADAGEDQSVTFDTVVALDGSGSYDIDGDSLTYQWAAEEEELSLSDSDTVQALFSPDEGGEYLFSLTVSDGEKSDTDWVTITVSDESDGGDDLDDEDDEGDGEYTTVTIPFEFDGAGTYQWKTESIETALNSWCLESLTINGTDVTNTWYGEDSLPEKIDGYYYLEYSGSYNWSHFEMK